MDNLLETLKNDPAFLQLVNDIAEKKAEEKVSGLRNELANIQKGLQSVRKHLPEDKVSILVSSMELDNLLPAFIIANGAASFGMQVEMFFTLWGITALKKKTIYSNKTIAEKMLTMMLPDTPDKSGVSRLNMLGVGAMMMRGMMKSEHVASLPDLMNLASELEVKMIACQMTMGIMGVRKEELRDGIEFGGVATYIESASSSKITLFI